MPNYENLQPRAVLTPNMMHVVQSAHLREESGERFVVVAAEINGASPVVSPLDHGSRLQSVAPYFVNVRTGPVLDFRPITERQQKLQMASADVRTLLLDNFLVILKI